LYCYKLTSRGKTSRLGSAAGRGGRAKRFMIVSYTDHMRSGAMLFARRKDGVFQGEEKRVVS
jgi:hypothetical protein